MPDTDPSITTYEGLGPEAVLSAVDWRGFQCDGRLLEMNSLRIVSISWGLRMAVCSSPNFTGRAVDDAAILEEHAFALDLASQDIDLVPPLADSAGATLRAFGPTALPSLSDAEGDPGL